MDGYKEGKKRMTAWYWQVCLVGSGGMLGAIGRYKLALWVTKRFPSKLPYGTLTVNLLGSFMLGWVMRHHGEDAWRLWLGTGFLGAFTTFSTLKLESFQLMRSQDWRNWGLYTGLSYTGGIMLVFLGYYG